MPCCLVDGSQRFEETYYLRLKVNHENITPLGENLEPGEEKLILIFFSFSLIIA
jgi:hypothetical protein